MNLTTKQIKQIIKEEFRKVLNESEFQRALSKWNKNFFNEPEAWEHQREENIKFIRNYQVEDAASGMVGNPEMLASILQGNHELNIGRIAFENFLDEVVEISERSGDAILEEIINSYIEEIKNSFAEYLRLGTWEGFNSAIEILHSDHVIKWSFGISTASDGYVQGSGMDMRYKVIFRDIYLIKEFVSFINLEQMLDNVIDVREPGWHSFENQVTIGLKQ